MRRPLLGLAAQPFVDSAPIGDTVSGLYPAKRGVTPDSDPGPSPMFLRLDSGLYLKMPYSQWRAALAWCHGCAQLIRAGTDSAVGVLNQLRFAKSIGREINKRQHG
jgi:hypothetical protein